MKYFFLIIAFLALGIFVFYNTRTHKVTIGGKTYIVEMASTESSRQQGLSGRDHLDADKGMLFVFPTKGIYSFWMKDTLIPLDIIFIDNNKIVEMTTLNPPVDNNIPTYTPTQKSQYVLELNANSGIKVGDEVKIKY
jgi:uncharacterized membrane protein (UPF0127 family)